MRKPIERSRILSSRVNDVVEGDRGSKDTTVARSSHRGVRFMGAVGLAASLVFAAMLMLFLLPAMETLADGPDEGYVVVVFPGGEATVRPISFTAGISRAGAIRMSSWDVIVDDSTGAICKIGDVGCDYPAENCFCPDNNWSSYKWDATASDWDDTYPFPAVQDGEIDGFVWAQYGGPEYGPPRFPGPAYAAASDALDWLRTQQSTSDGGYGGGSATVESVLSIGADKLPASDWRRLADSPSLLHYMLAKGTNYAATSPDAAGKLAVGLTAGDGCWPAQAMQPADYYSSTSGIYGSSYGTVRQSFAVLGTHALSQAVPTSATVMLKAAQQGSGAWEWSAGWGTDTNSTSLALQALLVSGESVSSSIITNGLAYLASAQNDDGGFTYDPDSSWGTDSDTNSTAYVIQALLEAGEDPLAAPWVISGSHPISYLLSMQLPDGSFEFQTGSGSSLMATQQAIPALLGRSFPLAVVDLNLCSTCSLPLVMKDSD